MYKVIIEQFRVIHFVKLSNYRTYDSYKNPSLDIFYYRIV